jgi:hypothetical protein
LHGRGTRRAVTYSPARPSELVAAAAPKTAPSRSVHWAPVVSVVILTLVLLAPAGGLLHASGQSALMEDGFMILLPQRVLHGALAYRDFDWLWGPAGLWFPALIHGLAGWTLPVSRWIGLGYAGLTVFSTYALVRRWSEPLGVAAGTVMALTDRASDLPEYAAIGCGVLALYFGYRSLIARGPRLVRYAVLAGGAAGLAALFRPDRGTGAALAVVAVFWGQRHRFLCAAAGFAIPIGAFLGYVVGAGFGAVVDNVVLAAAQVPGERYLALPLSNYRNDLWLALVAVGLAVVVFAGWHRRRVSPGSARGPVLLGGGILAVSLVPEFLQRADLGHLLVAGSLAVAFLPAALADLSLPARMRRIPLGNSLGYAAAVLALLGFAAYQEAVVPYAQSVAISLGIRPSGTTTVANDGHSFIYTTPDAPLVRQLIGWVTAHTHPGQTLFVGPGDLARPEYSDNSIAVLLPQLHDAMHFPDMNPAVARQHASVLAADVASADVVILDRQLDQASEFSDSSGRGSELAVQAITSHFCPAAQFGLYEVLLRCTPNR